MTPFTSVGKARWRVIYDLLIQVETGEVLSYGQMGEALDLDPVADRHTMQMAMRRAAKEHEVIDHRAVEAVPNVGYRVVQVAEHLRLARGHQQRAGRSLVRGHNKVVHVDLSDIEPETRRAFEVVAHAFALQVEFNRRMDVRQKRLEDVVEAVTHRTTMSETELAKVQARLAALERRGAGGDERSPDGIT